MGEMDFDGFCGDIFDAFGPFHKDDILRIGDNFRETEGFQFVGGMEAVAVEVPDGGKMGFFNGIFFGDNEGGAQNTAFITRVFDERLCESCLSGAKVAQKSDEHSLFLRAGGKNVFSQIGRQGGGLGF